MQLTQMNAQHLRDLFRQVIQEEISKFRERRQRRKEDRILTRKETANRLRRDLTTLWRYAKDGILVPRKKKGYGVYYLESEVNEFLEITGHE